MRSSFACLSSASNPEKLHLRGNGLKTGNAVLPESPEKPLPASGEYPRRKNSSSSGFNYRFTGQRYDPESKLYYYKGRYYDPKTGRFITRDPKGFFDGMNRYAYTGNNPVNYRDVMGFEKSDVYAYGSIVNIGDQSFSLSGVLGVFHSFLGTPFQMISGIPNVYETDLGSSKGVLLRRLEQIK